MKDYFKKTKFQPDITTKFDISKIAGVQKEPEFEAWKEDIYGKRSIALLGKESLDISVDVTESELDITKIREAKQKDFTEEFPTKISAIADVSYEEKIPKDYKEIIKSYFERIAK